MSEIDKAIEQLVQIIENTCPLITAEPLLSKAFLLSARADISQAQLDLNEGVLLMVSAALDLEAKLQTVQNPGLLPKGAVLGLRRMVNYSWADIGYNYAGLTPLEKDLVTEEEFRALVAWATS